MATVILVIHLILALAIIALVLLQRSEGGGLGIGGGGGGMGSLASAGQTANVLTRTTAICAACFFTTSMILAVLAGSNHRSGNILDDLDNPPPVSAPAGEAAGEVRPDGTKPSSTPTDKAVDKAPEKVDSGASGDDKEVPKAPVSKTDPAPQNGAPSAPISQ